VKRTLLILGASAMLATGAFAQMNDLMRRERLSETEAASAIAISRGLGLRLDYVARVGKDISAKIWELGPVFYISERNNLDPYRVWQEHRRGTGWMEIDRNRGSLLGRGGNGGGGYGYGGGGYGTPPRGYDDNRGGFGDNRGPDRYGDRYDDSYRNRRGGLADLIGDILGRRDDDDYYRGNRDRYGRNGDRAYEQRVWDQIFQRAFSQNASRLWRYVDRGTHIGDLALAMHVSRVARTQPERVMDELVRTKNWNRVREHFGISRDWESRERNWNDRGRNRDRNIWEDIFEIIR
jgi:hypothetical protein